MVTASSGRVVEILQDSTDRLYIISLTGLWIEVELRYADSKCCMHSVNRSTARTGFGDDFADGGGS
jgi:hypothetical protein